MTGYEKKTVYDEYQDVANEAMTVLDEAEKCKKTNLEMLAKYKINI